MKSFRSEIENPIVEKDILELEEKIVRYKLGQVDEERFRSLRLARGVYGQRQLGVQMVRIKIPFGQLDSRKLHRICDVSQEYSRGRLHITTRQDIQIHYVSLDRTPVLWAELEKDEITLREACGNTVRNITASETSGIDPDEPFDPRPYAEAMFSYFLRNPICQEMGRKFKISFSNTDKDTGMAFMHDLGFVAKNISINGQVKHGFQVMIAGGLGSQSIHAHSYSEILEADQIIPFTEAVLRVFERYGERAKRMKARLKFLVKEWGLDAFFQEVERESSVLARSIPIEYTERIPELSLAYPALITRVNNQEEFELWKKRNVQIQKNGLYAIGIKVRLGDLYIDQARILADLCKSYAGDELTLTINQNVLVRHVEEKALQHWYVQLKSIGLADIGYNRFNDITACPGTDTCNLGIASSTGLAEILEHILTKEYPQLAGDPEMNIKISGCMNSCGQHMISTIGFQGMSMKSKDKRVLPATQILLGGGRLGNGEGRFGDKVLKIPSKKTPEALRAILDDYMTNKNKGQDFLSYYDQQGKIYFYDLLKELGNLDRITESDFLDWGTDKPYQKAIGIGECAGVVIDLVSTLFYETEEKLELARRSLIDGSLKDSIYHSYSAFINTAKALLIAEDQKTNSHATILTQFDEQFVDNRKIELNGSFTDLVLALNKEKQTADFAQKYLAEALDFYRISDQFRLKTLEQN